MLDFIDLKTIYIIGHLFGVAIGAGGAFAGDYIFFQCIKDHKISKEEFGFIKNSSKMVWVGLILLILSGLGLFLLKPDVYMESTKFISKMTIVLIITLNGILFHFLHIPIIKKSIGVDLRKNRDFIKNKSILLSSGALSLISWIFAIVLGALRGVPYSVSEILIFYAIIILIGIATSQIIGKFILPKNF